MTSDSNKSVSVKEQLEKMFETMYNLEPGDMNAISYLQKCLKLNYNETEKPDVLPSSSEPSTSTEKVEINENKSKIKSKTNYKKVKLKNYSKNVKKSILKCRVCGVSVKTKSLLLKHLETNHIGTPISCRLCKRDFNNRPSYLCHISLKMCRKNNRIVLSKYYCDQCPKVFKFKRHHDKHIEGHKRNYCTYCDLRLTRRKHLVQHLMTVHSIKLERPILFKCEHCEKRYVKKYSLYHHMKQHAENKIICMECGCMSDTNEEHEKHFKEHEKYKPWKCNKCNDRFLRRQQYLMHLKRHDRYKCLTCDETFASKIKVNRHKQKGHSVQGLEPQMKCPHCPLAFQRKLVLQIHIKKHLDDKVMHCKYCNKKFRSPYLYFKHCTTTLHEINSPGKQILVCEICGKLFVKKYQLEKHLRRVHDDTKKSLLSCEYCGHKTSNKTHMERHMSLHLENKKEVICEQCGKAFYNKNTLKDHIAYVHTTQERQFKCDECPKAFKRNSELVRHKTSHSELRPHVCATCGVSYKRSTHLRRHEVTAHGTVSKNRRVQRLIKDENGVLVPIKDKSSNKKTEETSQNNQILSIMDMQFGEMVTLTLPEITTNDFTLANLNNDIIQTIELPNLVLNSNDSTILASDLVSSLDTNFSNQLINEQYTSNNFLTENVLQTTTTIQNSATCDILLPENRVLNLQSGQNEQGFTQNNYQF